MSERLRNIDEKGILERTGAVVLGILGWSKTVQKEIKDKALPREQPYQQSKEDGMV